MTPFEEMTREKAAEILKGAIKKPNSKDGYIGQALTMAIEALKQESITWIVGKDNCQVAVRNMPVDKMLKICAIIGEEEPCEDCVSREEAIENFASWYGYDYDNQGYYRLLKQMPSVKPKYTDEEIQKMQELEQAQLEKAYELGMQTSFEEWLSTFNTDSATECFMAVQELKRRLEGDNND